MSSFLTAITFVCAPALLEYDDEDENDWEDIPYESDIYDNVMLPRRSMRRDA